MLQVSLHIRILAAWDPEHEGLSILFQASCAASSVEEIGMPAVWDAKRANMWALFQASWLVAWESELRLR